MQAGKRLLLSAVCPFILIAFVGCRLFPMAPLEVVRVATDHPQRISVEFSAPPDPARVEAAMLLRKNDMTVHGRVSVEGTIAHFVPDEPVDSSQRYRFTVSTRAEDIHGNALRFPYLHEFGAGQDEAPLRIAAEATSPHSVTLSFSEPVAPDTLYEHLRVMPDRRHRIEFADTGETVRIVFLSPTTPNSERSLRVMQGMRGSRGSVLGSTFEYTSPALGAVESPQRITLHFYEPDSEAASLSPTAGYTHPDLLPTYERYGRNTAIRIEFANPVRSADVERAIRISPRMPVTVSMDPATHVHQAHLELEGPLDADTLYTLEIGRDLHDRDGEALPRSLYAGIRPLESDYSPLRVEELRFAGERLTDGGVLDLGGFAPHTDIQFAEVEMVLTHAASATVSTVDVARAFRIRAWANSARFRLIAVTREPESPTAARFRLQLEVTDEVGRFGIVSVYLLQGLADSLGNTLEQEWRVDLNQIGAPGL
jgi:hypothetical protein